LNRRAALLQQERLQGNRNGTLSAKSAPRQQNPLPDPHVSRGEGTWGCPPSDGWSVTSFLLFVHHLPCST